MIIEIVEGNHTLKPAGFIFFIIEVSSLAIGFDLVINIFNLLEFGLCVEVLLFF
jgi:hypothetical protein